MNGKTKCKILKQIRQQIADENDIPYVTRECTHQGECRGTCPKCEAELRYLEAELENRRALGKKVAVAAVAVGLSAALTGCVMKGVTSNRTTEQPTEAAQTTGEEPNLLLGQIAETVEGEIEVIEGEIAAPTDETEEPPELLGDVVEFPESGENDG